MLNRGFILLGLVISVALAAGTYANAETERTETSSSGAKTIASMTTSDFRVVLSAAKRNGGAAPTAAVTAITYERRGSGWQRTGVRRLAGPYFWKTVTGPRAVCGLEIRTTGAQARFRPRAVVQVLLSPALGCGPTASFPLAG